MIKVDVIFTNQKKQYTAFFDSVQHLKNTLIGEKNNKKIKIADVSQKEANFLSRIITYNSVYIYPEFKKLLKADDIETNEAWTLKIQIL